MRYTHKAPFLQLLLRLIRIFAIVGQYQVNRGVTRDPASLRKYPDEL